jgi:hypothetical protein
MNNMSPDHSGLSPKPKAKGLSMLPAWALGLGLMVITLLTGLLGLKALVLLVVVSCYLVGLGAYTAAKEGRERKSKDD